MSNQHDDQKKPRTGGNVVPLGAAISDFCSIVTFATSCGVPVDEVVEWVETGTIPSMTFGDFRMVNVGKLRQELLSGKEELKPGDYSND